MRRVAKRIILIAAWCGGIICLGCVPSEEILYDCYSLDQFKKLVNPSFNPYFMNVKSDEKSRIDIYIQMPYTHLRFEKTAHGFRASYGCTFIIKDSEGQIVQTKEADRLLEPKTYEETVSSRFDFFLQSFILEPGSYLFEIISLDNLSQLRYRHKQKYEAQKFSSSRMSASTELLLDTVLADEDGITLRPVLPWSVSLLNNSLGIFQELYNVRAGDTVTVTQSYSVPKNGDETEERNYYLSPPYKISLSMCMNEYDSLYFKSDSTFTVSNDSIVRLFQFYPLPTFGNTGITRTIIRKNALDGDTLTRHTTLYRRDPRFWSLPSVEDIVSAMRYILRRDEYDSIAAVADEAKRKKIYEFWQDHGGFQGKLDFERRVKEANTLFTSCTEGSKTPMGIVYIICGVPDYIDCRYSLTENWYYTIGERTYSIKFRRVNTESGFPYYEVIPLSMNESVWQYFVEGWRKK